MKNGSKKMVAPRFMKNYKGPRKQTLLFLFITIVVVGAMGLFIYSLFLYFGLFTGVDPSTPTGLSKLKSTKSTTLDAQSHLATTLQSAGRIDFISAPNKIHGEKSGELKGTSQARKGFKHFVSSTSIPDVPRHLESHLDRFKSTQKQQHSEVARKDYLLQKDPEANRVGPLYSFYPGGFVDPGELVVRKCRERKPVVHMMVFSAPSHWYERNAIRKTWANTRLDCGNVTVGFLVGLPQHPSVELGLIREQSTYGDLVRPDFMDSYRNLTLKTIYMLQWFTDYCNARYLLKIDDDVALSATKLQGVLRKHASVSFGIIGHVARHNPPIRDVQNKYYTSPLQWPENKTMFPPFTSGPSYLITGNATKLLLQRALQVDSPIEFLPLEDVLITGVIAPAAKVTLLNEPTWLSEESSTKLFLQLFGERGRSHLGGKPTCMTTMNYVTYHPVSYRYMPMMFEALQPNCSK